MKYSILSFRIVSLLSILIFFLITISVAFAQTTVGVRPGVSDVNNVRSLRPQATFDAVPTPTLLGNTQDVQKADEDSTGAQKNETEARALKAQRGNTTDKPRSFIDKARSILQERLLGTNNVRNQEADKEQREAKLKEQKKDRVSKFFNNIKRKVDAAISRLEKLSERIESRIVKFEERDIDMTEARLRLKTAQGSIVSATDSMKSATEHAQDAFTTGVSRNTFGSVISKLAKAKESLKDAHASLVEVIRIMKANISNNQKTDTDNDDTDETN